LVTLHAYGATPETFKLLGSWTPLHHHTGSYNDKCMVFPVVEGRLFMRGFDGIHCHDLRNKESRSRPIESAGLFVDGNSHGPGQRGGSGSSPCRMQGVIKNTDTYRRESELERWELLRQMSPEESIAIGEALLTSEMLALADFPDDDQPQSLAISLGIAPQAVRT